MAFTAKDVAKLRETTGAGMMDCKKALEATDGDMEKAAEYLRKQGVSIAAKKAGRIASEGIISAYVCSCKQYGALAEVNCESDFVAKGDSFVELGGQVAKAAAKSNPADNDALLAAKCCKECDKTVNELIIEATAKIGEKLSLRRFVRYENKNGFIESYIHMGGKIGVLLELETGKDLSKEAEFGVICHDIAMHIAAASPKYVYSTEIPKEEEEHEMGILKAQALNEGKPAAVVEKMIVGRIKKYYKEICLVEQEFVKDSSMSVGQVVEALAKRFATSVKIVRFTRLVMGEGLEKKTDNLAEEVAKMQNK